MGGAARRKVVDHFRAHSAWVAGSESADNATERAAQSKGKGGMTELEELRSEVSRLRAVNAELSAEVERLRAELAEYALPDLPEHYPPAPSEPVDDGD